MQQRNPVEAVMAFTKLSASSTGTRSNPQVTIGSRPKSEATSNSTPENISMACESSQSLAEATPLAASMGILPVRTSNLSSDQSLRPVGGRVRSTSMPSLVLPSISITDAKDDCEANAALYTVGRNQSKDKTKRLTAKMSRRIKHIALKSPTGTKPVKMSNPSFAADRIQSTEATVSQHLSPQRSMPELSLHRSSSKENFAEQMVAVPRRVRWSPISHRMAVLVACGCAFIVLLMGFLFVIQSLESAQWIRSDPARHTCTDGARSPFLGLSMFASELLSIVTLSLAVWSLYEMRIRAADEAEMLRRLDSVEQVVRNGR